MKPPFTAVRKVYHVPTNDFNDLIWRLWYEIKETATGNVEPLGGPGYDEIDWLFENRDDALWFMLKYGGKDVTNEFKAWQNNGLD